VTLYTIKVLQDS